MSGPKIPDTDDSIIPDTFGDEYLNEEVALIGGASNKCDVQYSEVTKRLRDAEGRSIGMANKNPLLNTREYAVEFRDGRTESLSSNLIAR